MKREMMAALALSALVATGCHKANDKEDETAHYSETAMEERVYSLPDYHCSDSVRVGGNLYTYDILRRACDSLPKVEDELGVSVDNTIRLTLTRNGHTYYSQTFTKRMFQSSIDATFYGRSILDGIRYTGGEAGKGLTFSVAVSEPNSDMTIPFALTVADNGGVSFVKEEVMDVELQDEQTQAY